MFITAKITFIFTALLMFIISLINTGRRMFNLCPLLFTAAFDTAYHDEGEREQKGNVKTRDKISISPSSENIWARVTEWSTSFFFHLFFVVVRQATNFNVTTNGLHYVIETSVTFSPVGVLSKIWHPKLRWNHNTYLKTQKSKRPNWKIHVWLMMIH